MLEEFTAAAFARFLAEGKLMAARCQGCGALYLPPRPLCRRCFGQAMAWQEIAGEGKLLAFTAIAVAPAFLAREGYGRERPYVMAVVELREGLRIAAPLVEVDATPGNLRFPGGPEVDGREPQALRVGLPVEACFPEWGPGEGKRPRLAFRPRSGSWGIGQRIQNGLTD